MAGQVRPISMQYAAAALASMTKFEAPGCASDMEVAISATKGFLNALYLIGEDVREEQAQRAIMNLALVAILKLQAVEQQREALVQYLEGGTVLQPT